MRRTAMGCSAAIVLAMLHLPCSAAEWRGWRGLEQQGRELTGDAPLTWSTTENVAWTTPIRGKGYSSPVVSKDSVLVTTAYPGYGPSVAKRVVGYGVLALGVLLLVLAAVFGVRTALASPLSLPAALAAAVQVALVATVMHFFVVGFFLLPTQETGHGFQQARWHFSLTVAGVCVLLLASQFAARSRWRLVLGAVALALAATAFFGRPHQEYYLAHGIGMFVPAILGLPAVMVAAAILIFLRAILSRRSQAEPAAPAEGGKAALLGVAARLALFGVAGLAGFAGLRWAIPHVLLKLYYNARVPVEGEMSGLCRADQLLSVLVTAFVLWAIADVAGAWPRRLRLGKPFVAVALCLPALFFVERNLLGVSRQFVRAVVCVDRGTGATKWTRECFPGPELTAHHLNSQATPTPLVDEERVYAYFGTPGLICTDHSGKVLWTNQDLPFEGCIHGVGASPILTGDLILVDGGQPPAPYLAAVDRRSGQIAWKTSRPPFPGHGEHRCPLVTSVGGRPVAVIWGWRELRGCDLNTGAELWCYPIERHAGEVVASMVVDGDTLYLPHVSKMRALSLQKLLDKQDPVLWTTDMDERGPNSSSPVLAGPRLFTVSENKGYVTCLKAATGEILWQERLGATLTLASLTQVRDRIYVSHASGVTQVFRNSDRFELLATNDLKEPIYASAAVADGRLFLRTLKRLWCLAAPTPGTPGQAP